MRVAGGVSAPCPRIRDPGAWCIFCYANKRAKGGYKNHRYYVSAPTKRIAYSENPMKRPALPGKSNREKWVCPDKEFQKLYPTITQYLCDGFWEDGKPREPSSLSVRMDGAETHVSLSDHALQCSFYTAAGTLTEGLSLMEEALAAGRGTWRPWKTGKR